MNEWIKGRLEYLAGCVGKGWWLGSGWAPRNRNVESEFERPRKRTAGWRTRQANNKLDNDVEGDRLKVDDKRNKWLRKGSWATFWDYILISSKTIAAWFSIFFVKELRWWPASKIPSLYSWYNPSYHQRLHIYVHIYICLSNTFSLHFARSKCLILNKYSLFCYITSP